MSRWAPLVAACAVVALPAGALAAPRVVLVPFENAARRGAPRELVMPEIEQALRAKGWDVVSGEPVEQFLQSRRIRFLDSLGAGHVVEILAAHGAEALVVGSVLAYDPDPRKGRVTIAMRIAARDGRIVWTDVSSAVPPRSQRAAAKGKQRTIQDVVRDVIAKLAGRLPGSTPLAEGDRRAETFEGAPRVFRSRDLLGQHLRICILPLQNFSSSPEASRVLDAVLQHRISARPEMSTVQPGDLRAAVVKAKLTAPSILSLEQLRGLSDVLGTSLFLRGTILAYGGPDPSGAAAPIELYLILIDARSGEIMWSGLHRRAGSDFETLLGFGGIVDDAALAGRVVAELLDGFTRKKSTMEAEWK